MPELPEVEALAHHLREHAVGSTVFRLDVASLSVLKTAVPPYTELHGREITGATRHGKHLDVVLGDLHLVIHLARAGWLRWSDALSPAPLKPGKGPISLRVHLESASGPGFDLTEAGTKKGLAVWIVSDPAEVASVARLGPDALAVDASRLRELFRGKGTRLKWALTDQSVIAGIGNAYSDEIMHRAKLSPYATVGKLDDGVLEVLAEAIREVETDAVERSVGQKAARLKGRSGLGFGCMLGLGCLVRFAGM